MRLKALQVWTGKAPAEYADLEKKIAYYNQLLASEEMLVGVLKEELTEIRDKYGDERKTEIGFVEDEIDIEDLIQEEQCVYTLTSAAISSAPAPASMPPRARGAWGRRAWPPGRRTMSQRSLRLHPRLYPLLHQHRQGLPEEGVSDPRVRRTARGTNIVNVLPVERRGDHQRHDPRHQYGR